MNAEKKGLSKREKVLLSLLLCVGLIYAAFQYAFMPMLTQYGDKKEELTALGLDKQQMEMRLASESVVRESYEIALALYQEVKQVYSGIEPYRDRSREAGVLLFSEEFDNILTDLCLKHQLGIKSLYFTPDEPYDFVLVKEGEEAQSDAPAAEAAIAVMTADLTVMGSYDAVNALLDEVTKIPYLRVNGVYFDQSNPLDTEIFFVVSIFKEFE